MNAAIYARVSTDDQRCDAQLAELRAYVARMGWSAAAEYVETASGKAGAKRPALDRLLADARLRKFDAVLVWKLDRFGRSLQHMIENVSALDRAGVRFIAVTQNIDTDARSPMGNFMMHIFGAFAEFERSLIVERVHAGVGEYRRAFGAGEVGTTRHSRSGKDLPPGRPARIFRRDRAAALRKQGKSFRAIAAELGVPVSTVVDAVREKQDAAI
jgi:putative DNA-invertase from lambdoid prophage Rac